MRRATKDDVKAMLELLHKDVINCLYMYINLKFFGAENPNIPLWLDEDEDGVHTVVMKYYDAFRVYTVKEEDEDVFQAVCQLIDSTPHRLVFATYDYAIRLSEALKGEYFFQKSVVVRQKRYRNFDFTVVEKADISDLDEIVDLILDDEYYMGQYSKEGLKAEMKERMESGMGRSYVIRRDGKIVAHDSITAEVDNLAIGSMFICHKDYRNQFIGETLENFMLKMMDDEGKELYGFILEERRARMFERSKNAITATCGKLRLMEK